MGAIDTINAFARAYNAQQWDKAASYLTDDFTVSNGTETEGKQAFLAEAQAFFACAPDYQVTVENPRADGNKVYTAVRGTGTQTKPLQVPGMPAIPATGKHFSITTNQVVTMRGDKISSLTVSLTSPGLLAQLGVQPPA